MEGGEPRCGAAPCWALRNLWDLFPQSCPGPWALADTAPGQSGYLPLWENVLGSRLALEPSIPALSNSQQHRSCMDEHHRDLCTLSHPQAHVLMLTLSFQHSHAPGPKEKACLNSFSPPTTTQATLCCGFLWVSPCLDANTRTNNISKFFIKLSLYIYIHTTYMLLYVLVFHT